MKLTTTLSGNLTRWVTLAFLVAASCGMAHAQKDCGDGYRYDKKSGQCESTEIPDLMSKS